LLCIFAAVYFLNLFFLIFKIHIIPILNSVYSRYSTESFMIYTRAISKSYFNFIAKFYRL